jgi:hypothetical protein
VRGLVERIVDAEDAILNDDIRRPSHDQTLPTGGRSAQDGEPANEVFCPPGALSTRRPFTFGDAPPAADVSRVVAAGPASLMSATLGGKKPIAATDPTGAVLWDCQKVTAKDTLAVAADGSLLSHWLLAAHPGRQKRPRLHR